MKFLSKVKEIIWSFKLAVIIVGFIASFLCGYMISIPKCRGVSKEVVNLVRKFESSEGEGILLVVFSKDGRQHYYYNKNSPFEPKLEGIINESKSDKKE